ncbi:MAG: tRNA lysidine(34) synthetase TilS [Brevinematales bacterium]|nr:tRNA lysidine(34) synthetase TilS [Brevinematales bacterium]
MIQNGDKVLLALSGGADSVFLAHILVECRDELGITIAAAHIHHGIRGDEADRDRDFCRDFAERMGMEYYSRGADAPGYARGHGLSLEHAARDLRYRELRAIKDESGAAKIATAHHLDDLAETMLFRMFTGTGPSGLRAIRPVNRDIIRPVLFIPKSEISAYLAANCIAYIVDSTNLDTAYPRNYIREKILPVIAERFPGFREHMKDLSLIVSGEEEVWERLARRFGRYAEFRGGRAHVAKEIFADRPKLPLARRYIRGMITRRFDSSYHANLSFFGNLIRFSGKSEGTVMVFRAKKFRVFSSYDEYVFEKAHKNCAKETIHAKLLDNFSIRSGETTLGFERGSGTCGEKNIDRCEFNPAGLESVIVRGRNDGDRIEISGGRHKKVQDLLVDMKVPRWMRDEVLVIGDDAGDVIAVYIPGYGFRVSSKFYTSDGEPCMTVTARNGD